MGLSLRNIGKKIWEAATPQNEEALRRSNASIQAANQRIQSLGNNAKGVLSNPSARTRFAQDTRPTNFNFGKEFGSGLIRNTVGNTARLHNTVAAIIPEAYSTVRLGAAMVTKNKKALNNALIYNRAKDEFIYNPGSGLAGAGTMFRSPEEKNTISTKQAIVRGGATGVGAWSEVAAPKVGKLVAGEAPKLGVRLARSMGGSGAIVGTGDAANQFLSTGKVDPIQSAKATVGGAVLGIPGAFAKPKVSMKDLRGDTAKAPLEVKSDALWNQHNTRAYEAVGRASNKKLTAVERKSAREEALALMEMRNKRAKEINSEGGFATIPGKKPTPQVSKTPNIDNILENKLNGKTFDYKGPNGNTQKAIKIGDNNVRYQIFDQPNQILMPKIYVDKQGTGLGSKFINTLKEIADEKGKNLVINNVENPKYFDKFSWLEYKDGAYRYSPTTPVAQVSKTVGKNVNGAPEPVIAPTSKPKVSLKTNVVKRKTPGMTEVSLNTERLDLPEKAKVELKKATTKTIPKMTNKSIVENANQYGINAKGVSEAQQRKIISEQLNLRKSLINQHDQHQVMLKNKATDSDLEVHVKKWYLDSNASTEQGTTAGRVLQARNIVADRMTTPQQKVFKLLRTAGVDADKAAKAFAKVDFNNPTEVATAYRKLVPARFEEWLDKYRYSNMLSSPLTHVINTVSNASALGIVAPARKIYEGAIDATRSAITGGDRTRFAGEAGAYLKGVKGSVNDALTAFKDVMSGKREVKHPDLYVRQDMPLATEGAAGVADKVISGITKLMEAADQFGMTLVEGGEKQALKLRASKGVKLSGQVDTTAKDQALYTMYRQKLGNKDQGHVLHAIDAVPKAVQLWKTSKNPMLRTISKLVFPFINTPTNLFKQGIEYSPLGVTTLAGNADKTAQLAKMAIGTTVMGITGGLLAAGGDLTFSEPSDAKQRDAFRSEGKQPYAVKIGGKWIGYSKLHPAVAFNLALVSAVKQALDNHTIDQSGADQVLSIGGGIVGFMRDQSYMKAVGDLTSSLQNKDGTTIGNSIASQAGNTINQVVPFRSMVSWIGRMIDPTQRKVDYSAGVLDQMYQQVIKDIPGLNSAVKPRENPYTKEAITNDNPILNSFSPARVTNDKGFGQTGGLTVNERKMQQTFSGSKKEQFRQDILAQKGTERLVNKEKDAMKESDSGIKQLSDNTFYAKVGNEWNTFDTKDEADTAIAKEKFTKSGKNIQTYKNVVFRRGTDGKTTSTPKLVYDNQLNDANLTKYKRNKDLGSWMKTAEAQLDNIDKQLQDPSIDPLEAQKLYNEAESLAASMQKYSGYGGFTKGKSSASKAKFANPRQYAISLNSGGAPSGAQGVRQSVKFKSNPTVTRTSKPTVASRKSMV